MNGKVLKRPSFLMATNFVSVVPDDVAKFRTRGVLLLKAGRETSISLSQNQLSEEDRIKLKVSPAAREESARVTSAQQSPGDVVHCYKSPHVFLVNVYRSFLFLQEVAAVDGLYRIRVPRVFLQSERQAEGHLTTFVRAVCVFIFSHADISVVLLTLFSSSLINHSISQASTTAGNFEKF